MEGSDCEMPEAKLLQYQPEGGSLQRNVVLAVPWSGPKVANNMCMSIWGGRLRLCPVDLKSHCPELKIWEFREEAGGKGKSKKTKKNGVWYWRGFHGPDGVQRALDCSKAEEAWVAFSLSWLPPN
ncbi:hypothetical protein M0R45_013619 [Rubus argutus]|uniref:Uncharacterized protein n=1 Tax=Rubus argutus TaxID=59490 RepID=A0AAW1XLR9_RUBAR